MQLTLNSVLIYSNIQKYAFKNIIHIIYIIVYKHKDIMT